MFKEITAPKMQVGAKYLRNNRVYTCIALAQDGRATMAGVAGMVFVEPDEYQEWECIEWTSLRT